MSNYFFEMLPAEELAQVNYIPTVSEFLTWIENKWADLPAVSDTNITYTYKELCERVARRRALLNGLGLQKGDKIAIHERTSIDAVESFLAATSAGYVAIMLPTQMPAETIIGCCMKFGVKLLIARDEFKENVAGAPCTVISSKDMADETAPVAVIDKDEPAAIFFTGGTTGTPKGAILPHRALMRGAFNGIYAPGPQLGYHRQICFLPLSHVFGLIASTMSVFYKGGLWFSAEDMKATIGKLPMIRPTCLVLVPGLCEVLLGLAKMYGPQFFGGQLKCIISGAACVAPSLMEEFDKLGVAIHAGYGMTEGANLTSANAFAINRSTSVGKIYPEQEVKVVDGELWFRGDNVFLGYYGDPKQTAEVLTEDGWLKTGDLVRFDEDGFMYIIGRIKNLIILSNGENVSPESLEEPFYLEPTVKDVLVKENEGVISIDILPRMEAFEGKSQEEIYEFFRALVDKINATVPTTHRISRVNVRKEDFKRTGSLKVSRKDN